MRKIVTFAKFSNDCKIIQKKYEIFVKKVRNSLDSNVFLCHSNNRKGEVKSWS